MHSWDRPRRPWPGSRRLPGRRRLCPAGCARHPKASCDHFAPSAIRRSVTFSRFTGCSAVKVAGGLVVWSKDQRIASRRTVYELARDLDIGQDLADPAHIVADFLWKQRRVGPGSGQQLVDGEESMRMVDQELQ